MTRINEIIAEIEAFAPKELAMAHDPIGLQIGDPNQDVTKMLVTLDVRPEVVAEAIAQDIHFIFSHHPAIFRPVQQLDYRNPQQKMYAELIKHDITVYSAHTNIDQAKTSMNDWLMSQLPVTASQGFVKITSQTGNEIYLGRKAELQQAMPLADFVQLTKQAYDLAGVRVISPDLTHTVQKIAIIGGDGGKFYPEAVAQDIDVFLTGDVYYHTAHDMLAAGLNVIDLGHNVEKIFIAAMTENLVRWSQANNWNLEVIPSKLSTEPFTFL